MTDADTLELLTQLHDRSRRTVVAQRLAIRLGVETLVFFSKDRALDTLIPAPGFPQTLYGGPTWRALIARCLVPGTYRAEVDLPVGSSRPAIALARDGAAVVLIGGSVVADALRVLEALLPLLEGMFAAEQAVILALAESVEAKEAAARAHALASALDAARAEGAQLNAELREEHRHKDDFLAMLAHELRNPLAPLVTSIDLLRRRGLDAHDSHTQLDVMVRQVNQLTRLVEDLLDVSRVSRGRIDLRRQRLNLGEVLRDAVRSNQALLDARRHTLRVTIADTALMVDADPVRLTQVFANLLHNAAKYTDPGGSIVISVERELDAALIRITDTGVGITPELLPRVFELFTQAPVSLARAQGGLGIGLTLVRNLVELHGGQVSAQSAGAEMGSTFLVRLPLAQGGALAMTPPAVTSETTSSKALRVLVVDDNEDAANTLSIMLRLMGHHAEVAYSGLAALQVAADLDADLYLLDIGLPGMDGYQVAKHLQRTAKRTARFVALTGYGTEEDKNRTRAAGFDEHIVKPINPETLTALTTRAAKTLAADVNPVL